MVLTIGEIYQFLHDNLTDLTMRICRLKKWDAPSLKYPRRSCGSATIADYYWNKGGVYHAYKQAPLNTTPYDFIIPTKRLRTTDLQINGNTCMVDDPPHWWTIQQYATEFSGHVLVVGLGLGLIIHALKKNLAVTKITVIEKESDVISLIAPLIPFCNIICDDYYQYDFVNREFDGVFFDIYVGNGFELLGRAITEMNQLRQRFPYAVHRILGFNNNLLLSDNVYFEE